LEAKLKLRSNVIGRLSLTINKFENEIYHVELYRNKTLMNLVAGLGFLSAFLSAFLLAKAAIKINKLILK
jgi:hypothetical protein